MMTQGFNVHRRSSKGRENLQEWNRQLISYLKSVGPWWDKRQGSHALFAMRCAGPHDRLKSAAVKYGGWPQIWDSQATTLCFEPATLTRVGKGVLVPYGVGGPCHQRVRRPSARRLLLASPPQAGAPAHARSHPLKPHVPPSFRCPVEVPPIPTRAALLSFSGSQKLWGVPNRAYWVDEMQKLGPPSCQLELLSKASRKHFNLTEMELTYTRTRFSLGVPGHVGPRKANFDAMKCGALLLFASDHTPFPFPHDINFSKFSLRVNERANVSRTLDFLRRLPVGQLQHMQVAMLASLPTLDYNRGLVDAALRQVVRVQRGVGGHSARTPLEVIRV